MEWPAHPPLVGGGGVSIHHHLGDLMFGLGMRLLRKAQNKTRTLHVSFVCALMKCCVKNMRNMNDM